MKNNKQQGSVDIFSAIAAEQGDGGTPLEPKDRVVSTIEGIHEGIGGGDSTPNSEALIDRAITSAVGDQDLADSIYTPAIREAALMASAMAADQLGSFAPTLSGYVNHVEGMDITNPTGKPFSAAPGDGFSPSVRTLEHYEEQATDSAYRYATTFNLDGPIQDSFNRLFFKMFNIPPKSIGYTITSEEVVIIKEFNHGPNGEPIGSRGIPMLRALDEPNLLEVDHTKIVPSVLPDREKYFVDAALIAPKPILNLGEDIEIAPLRPGIKFDLISLGQSAGDLTGDVRNRTDTIDPAIKLNSIFVKFGDDIIKFNTRIMPSAVFTFVGTANDRRMTIGLEIDELVITPETVDHTGADLVTLAAIKADELKVRFSIYISGYVNLDSGTGHMSIASAELNSVRDIDDNIVSHDDAAWTDLHTLGEDSEFVGFFLDASMTNANRREIGQLLELRGHHQPYTVSYKPPITMLRAPNAMSVADDQKIISVLTARARLAGNLMAPKALLAYHKEMSVYHAVRDDEGNYPSLMGPARYEMNPVFLNRALDVKDITQSVSTHEIKDDITHAVINFINTSVEEMLRKSHICYAYEQRFGAGVKPTVVLGGSYRIMQYLNHPGNEEILCPGFQVLKEATAHPDFYDNDNDIDRLYISFNNPAAGPVDPLSHGTFAWAPVQPVILNTPRSGAVSRELTVIPRQEHYVNTVVSALLSFEGLVTITSEAHIARVKAVV